MKLLALPAILLFALRPAAVRFESDGIRVGNEMISTKTIGLKTSGELPILVSASTIENLTATGKSLEVAVGEKKVLLDVGILLARSGEGYTLSTHGPAMSVECGARSLALESASGFKVTDKGFDFGKLGVLEGSALSAKVATTIAFQEPAPGTDAPLKSRERFTTKQRDPAIKRRIFMAGDPTIMSEAADSVTVRMLLHVSPTGSP